MSKYKIAIFKNKQIRRVIHNGEWWFSVIDVVEDEEKKQNLINKLAAYLQHSARPFVSLVPYITRVGYPKCEKWKIIVNTDVESDL